MLDNEQPVTQADAYREMVNNMGQDRPEHCWILTPFDTWERNPNYVGPEEPHPEYDQPMPEDNKSSKTLWEAEGEEMKENQSSECPYCGGEMTWCDICRMYSSYCCEDYGTCMCS